MISAAILVSGVTVAAPSVPSPRSIPSVGVYITPLRIHVTMNSTLHLQAPAAAAAAAAVAGTHRTRYCCAAPRRSPRRHTARTWPHTAAASASDQPSTSSSQQFSEPAGPWSFGFQCNERCEGGTLVWAPILRAVACSVWYTHSKGIDTPCHTCLPAVSCCRYLEWDTSAQIALIKIWLAEKMELTLPEVCTLLQDGQTTTAAASLPPCDSKQSNHSVAPQQHGSDNPFPAQEGRDQKTDSKTPMAAMA